jgi:putative membrane protein
MTTYETPVTNEIPSPPASPEPASPEPAGHGSASRELAGHGSARREPSARVRAGSARREPSARGRAPLSRAERAATGVAAVAVAGFAGYGFATHSPSTVGYVSSVLVIAAAVMGLRRAVLPPLLAAGLASAAIVTLAGGLIRVGHDVLYNANTGPYSPSLGTHYLQYDHFAHAYCSFVIVFACWFMLAAPYAGQGRRRDLVLLAVGAALGLGALNEMVEFIATLAHHGAHAGGYWNTGWDLVANFTGATAAGLVLARSKAGAKAGAWAGAKAGAWPGAA